MNKSGNKPFTVIDGKGNEFREDVGCQIVTAILQRDDAKYDKLRRILHPTVRLSVVTRSINCQQSRKDITGRESI